MLQTIHHKIQRGFSDSAKRYDSFSGLHRQIADKLFVQVANGAAPSALLDVGCGTGYLTGKLKDHFSQSKIIGLDFSRAMLEVAARQHEGIAWVLADGKQLPFSDGSFDRVVSNLAYQWSGDLSRSFSEARRVLAPNGILVATLFGHNTCQELFQSLQEAAGKDLQFKRLPGELPIRQALRTSGFNDPEVENEHIKIEFKSMLDLVSWLKSIGANNLPREGYLGREIMSRAGTIYGRNFPYLHGIGATFEVIRVYAKT